MDAFLESLKNSHQNRKDSQVMDDNYIKYVQECNEKVKTTGNLDFKAIPEFVWESKILLKNRS
jgi:hypothetical protein